MAEKIEFDLSVKNNDLSKNLKSAATQVDTLSNMFVGGLSPAIKDTEEAIAKANSSVNLFSKDTAVGVFAGQIAFQLLNSAINFVTSSLSESIAAFQEQENAISQLNQSLRATGTYSEETKNNLIAFSEEMQRNSKFADEAVLAQIAFVKSLGATSEMAKNIVEAAANMSAALGGSLEDNVAKLGKTLSGTTGKLGQYIPELKSLTLEQLKAGDAADIVNKKFAGASSNEFKTYSGSVAATKNAFNDLQEQIGQFLAKNSLTTAAIGIAKDVFVSLTDQVKLLNKAIEDSSTKKIGTDATDAANRLVELNKEIIDIKNSLSSPGGGTLISQDAEESVASLQLQLEKLVAERDKLESKLPYLKDTAKAPPKEKALDTRTKEEVEAERSKQEEISNLLAQGILERNNMQVAANLESYNAIQQANIDEIADLQDRENAKIAFETEKNLAELERIRVFESQKAELEAQAKLDKINANDPIIQQELEKEKINAEKLLALQKINNDAALKSTQKAIEGKNKLNDKARADDLKNQETFLNTAATLSSAKNKELAAIGKAAAITQIAIKTPPAIASSFEFGTKLGGPPLGFAFGAIAATAMAAQAGAIAGVQFEDGGIVGATSGADNRVATVRDGEMILNAGQQKKLLDMINGGGAMGGDIVIQVDGREIARAVRSQVQGGFSLA